MNAMHCFHFSGNNVFLDDSLFTNRFMYDEDIHAAYVQFTTTVGMFGITAGGRYEDVGMKSQLINTDSQYRYRNG